MIPRDGGVGAVREKGRREDQGQRRSNRRHEGGVEEEDSGEKDGSSTGEW